MIGGLYNTTSLLIEPTRALGELVRATDGGTMPLSSQRAAEGLRGAAEGLDAAPVPDRLPTGVTQFIPVVVKIMEAKAAEAAEADRAMKEPEPVATDAPEQEAAPVTGAEEAVPASAPDAPVSEAGETLGVYMTSAEPASSEPKLDTFI